MSVVVPMTEATRVGEARRLASALAEEQGFDETLRGRVAIVVNELTLNLLRHARGGQLIMRKLGGEIRGLELLAIDRGQGIADVGRAMRDGYSTSGTAGNGLGAIQRLSETADLFSTVGKGTVVMSRILLRKPAATLVPRGTWTVGAVCTPAPNERVSGDAWAFETLGPGGFLIVADGLGHGVRAADASTEAVRTFRAMLADASPLRPPTPAELLSPIHEALRKTRGAAVAIATLDASAREIRYAGVGNIAAAVVGGAEPEAGTSPVRGDRRARTPGDGHRSMVSHNGTVGAEMRKVQEFVYPWPVDASVVMHSDGIGTHWSLSAYPGLAERHPSVVAGVLLRDFERGRDDATVVVLRDGTASESSWSPVSERG